MEYPYDRRGVPPWVWILVVLAAILLVFVVWWVVAAQSPEQTVVVPGPETQVPPPAQQPGQTPTTQPAQPQTPAAEPPRVVERQPDVNIYVGEQPRNPSVTVVPEGQQPPRATQRMRQVDLPGQFSYAGNMWQPSDEAVSGDAANLKDTGATIGGNVIYADKDTQPPYNQVYLETSPGSGIYVKYTQR